MSERVLATYHDEPESRAAVKAHPAGSHVDEELTGLERQLDMLNENIGKLEDRLSFYLSDSVATEGERLSSPEDYRVPMAERVRTTRRTVQALAERVGSLVTRFEG